MPVPPKLLDDHLRFRYDPADPEVTGVVLQCDRAVAGPREFSADGTGWVLDVPRPALHRLEDRGWISSFWGTSENNRRARYYRLTPKGRAQLVAQTSRWDQIVRAINRILRPAD